jgi:hypothetical protein
MNQKLKLANKYLSRINNTSTHQIQTSISHRDDINSLHYPLLYCLSLHCL